MNTISTFHISIIAAFVLITGAGGGAAYYYSGLLSDCRNLIDQQESDIHADTANHLMPSESNLKVVSANIDAIHKELDPIIHTQLEPSATKLQAITNITGTVWREQLDSTVEALRQEAKKDSVQLPAGNQFYFGFSRYLSSPPSGSVTGLLDKQLYAIKNISDLLMADRISRIVAIRRTYEEDQGAATSIPHSDADNLAGYGSLSRTESYRSYPLQFDFECSPVVFRKVINDLVSAPDIYVIRSVSVKNSQPNSPKKGDLVGMANSTDHPDATTPLKGPQDIFGGEYLQVRLQIDLIEWLGDQTPTSTKPPVKPGH